MVIAITRTRTEDVRLACDADSTTPTTFVVRTLSAGAFLDFQSEGRVNRKSLEVLIDDAVVGWRDLLDDAGKRVDPPSVQKGRTLTEILPATALDELAAELLKRARLTKDEAKNSVSPPSA